MFRGGTVKQTDLFLLGIFVGMLLFWQYYKWRRAARLQRKVDRARWGELQALDLLAAEGYEIVELQKRMPVGVMVDGQECKTYITADALVCKNGLRYVAEIKTGAEATRVTHAPTRRQLLEYFFVFQPHGILLVDMEQQKICKVEFKVGYIEKKVTFWGLGLLCFLGGIICGWYFRGGF